MDIDPQEPAGAVPTDLADTNTGAAEEEEQHAEDEGGDSDDEDREDPSDVAMVPMADMLNARFESENVRNGCDHSKAHALTSYRRLSYFTRSTSSKWCQQGPSKQGNKLCAFHSYAV